MAGSTGYQVNKLGFKITTFANIQQPDCDWQFKSTRPARPGIKVENALPFVKIRPVRMAVEHCSKFARHWVQVERTQVVEHVYVAAANENDIGFSRADAYRSHIGQSPGKQQVEPAGQHVFQGERIIHADLGGEFVPHACDRLQVDLARG